MSRASDALNAVCAYFTMFPLSFPTRILERHARPGESVLDPFCGRGTTNLAARVLGLQTCGIDASPIAVAVSEAKLVTLAGGPAEVEAELDTILGSPPSCLQPEGEFWSLAYRADVLEAICCLRSALLHRCDSPARKALRAIVLGALHGPLRVNGESSYLSNQCPRTFAPKPRYAVSFWRTRGLLAPRVDLRSIVSARARRYFDGSLPRAEGRISLADSRDLSKIEELCSTINPKWIITSPPYYGLRTYVQDQWLRAWFLGGPATVDYSYGTQISHRSVELFTADLRRVWSNVAVCANPRAKLVVRFGAINDRKVDPAALLKSSLAETPWRLRTIRQAGSAHSGKRQADAFIRRRSRAIGEIDAWAQLG